MNNNLYIKSLALDLRRIVQGEISGSEKMTKRFIVEALKWKQQIDTSMLSPRLKKILDQIEQMLTSDRKERLADDALLYSNLLIHFSS